MFDDFLKKAEGLCQQGESFATATVVRSEPPVSGKPGDRAIIREDRSIWGWIGGGCAQPMVIREALLAIKDGNPRLIRITNSSDQAEVGITSYKMECHSGGAIDIYIEPVLPRPQIVIFGRSPVARALAHLARDINYGVTVISPLPIPEDFPEGATLINAADAVDSKASEAAFVVVSTQGEDDEEAIERAVALRPRYVSFVASRVKGQKVIESLAAKGIASDMLDRLKFPAGIDIGASSPQEIAVSILAEIISSKRTRNNVAEKADVIEAGKVHTSLPTVGPDTAESISASSYIRIAVAEPKAVSPEKLDPVCGMTVDAVLAKYRSEYQSSTYYFCGRRCKELFEKSPERFLEMARQ